MSKTKKDNCRFYDDGCGNGEYISSMSVDQPMCDLLPPGKAGSPKCKGKISKCLIPLTLAVKLNEEIKKHNKEISNIQEEMRKINLH